MKLITLEEMQRYFFKMQDSAKITCLFKTHTVKGHKKSIGWDINGNIVVTNTNNEVVFRASNAMNTAIETYNKLYENY